MTRMRNKISFLLVFVILCSLYACNSNVLFDKNKQIENAIWKSSDVVKFTVPITDTTQGYNFFINIRNSSEYQYSNIFLFIKTFYPNGKISIDTVECYLADKEGKWLGKRSGKLVDNRILFRRAVQFRQKGTYSFEFEQAMRVEELKGIEDFGIRIEKFETKK